MASIKQKAGQCIDCPANGPEKPLTAKRCSFHYWKYRNSLKKPTGHTEDKNAKQKALDKWFVTQINQLPKHCENCNDYLNQYAPWGVKSYIAHIVPKRNFESVMVHPYNRAFLCIQCHTNYDNWSADKVVKMPVFPLMVERFKLIAPSITFEELKALPGYFIDLMELD